MLVIEFFLGHWSRDSFVLDCACLWAIWSRYFPTCWFWLEENFCLPNKLSAPNLLKSLLCCEKWLFTETGLLQHHINIWAWFWRKHKYHTTSEAAWHELIWIGKAAHLYLLLVIWIWACCRFVSSCIQLLYQSLLLCGLISLLGQGPLYCWCVLNWASSTWFFSTI